MILRVLTSPDSDLAELLLHDPAVRHTLRWNPSAPGVDQARTLMAAARVEQRRRALVTGVSVAGRWPEWARVAS